MLAGMSRRKERSAADAGQTQGAVTQPARRAYRVASLREGEGGHVGASRKQIVWVESAGIGGGDRVQIMEQLCLPLANGI